MTWRGTPGPWTVVRQPTSFSVRGADGQHVAGVTMSPTRRVDLIRDKQKETDAKGMAAVPQLVEALLAIRDRHGWCKDRCRACQIAAAALKAAGVTP